MRTNGGQWIKDQLVCIVSPSEKELDAGAAPSVRTYLLDPRTGDCRAVRTVPAKAASSPVAPNKNAFQPLHGSWGVVRATLNGEATHDASLLAGHWVFKGNELILQSPQKGKVGGSPALPAAFRTKCLRFKLNLNFPGWPHAILQNISRWSPSNSPSHEKSPTQIS